ncbi:F-box protein At5g49610-like [Sesamum indicum]|uniref:F-box protein At5g49610-like n=1 Tax=Sesamum indicum TaxID=4182 RepID=A0A8M8UQU6_SESIN|nr:F-box protein At5g49610-like [Sesamum indicum]
MEKEEDVTGRSVHFPEEILLEILVRLPAESIFRFRCVSKNWRCLISDPSFFSCYVERSQQSPPFAFIFQCGLKVEATSNDLILYQSNFQEPVYFLANSFTRKCVKIPMHCSRRSYGATGLISCVRNGITSYNVVRLVKSCDSSGFCLNLETFSSENGAWRSFKMKHCTFNVELDARPCVVYKGVLHWICNRMTALLAYDPGRSPDECRFISIPNETYNGNGINAILGVSGENLYYFEMFGISIQERELPRWKLWVLKDYKSGEWSLDQEGKERKIESISAVSNVLSTYSPLFPVALHPWNKDIVYFWYEGYILTFSVKKGWFEDKLSSFRSESIVAMWEIFPLSMPLCPTQLPQPQWDSSKLAMFADVKPDTEQRNSWA